MVERGSSLVDHANFVGKVHAQILGRRRKYERVEQEGELIRLRVALFEVHVVFVHFQFFVQRVVDEVPTEKVIRER